MDKLRRYPFRVRSVIQGRGGYNYITYLYTYRTQQSPYDPNPRSGWSKQWVTSYKDPFIYGDISKLIANQKWEIGKTLLISSWYDNSRTISSTGGYKANETISAYDSYNSSVVISALSDTEASLGTVWTQGFSSSDTVTMSNTDYIEDYISFNCGVSTSGGGLYEGKAFAFLIEFNWSANAGGSGGVVPITNFGTYNGSTVSISKVVTP